MRTLLKKLMILEVVSNKGRNPKLGKGFTEAYRFNPYNPLSYLTITIVLIVGVIMFGVVGIWKEVDVKNPFKWY